LKYGHDSRITTSVSSVPLRHRRILGEA
jgi:hypothetical protein